MMTMEMKQELVRGMYELMDQMTITGSNYRAVKTRKQPDWIDLSRNLDQAWIRLMMTIRSLEVDEESEA